MNVLVEGQQKPPCLTFHAHQQQVGGEWPPVVAVLLHVEPLPIEPKEVHHNSLPHSVVESLLQIHPGHTEIVGLGILPFTANLTKQMVHYHFKNINISIKYKQVRMNEVEI